MAPAGAISSAVGEFSMLGADREDRPRTNRFFAVGVHRAVAEREAAGEPLHFGVRLQPGSGRGRS